MYVGRMCRSVCLSVCQTCSSWLPVGTVWLWRRWKQPMDFLRTKRALLYRQQWEPGRCGAVQEGVPQLEQGERALGLCAPEGSLLS